MPVWNWRYWLLKLPQASLIILACMGLQASHSYSKPLYTYYSQFSAAVLLSWQHQHPADFSKAFHSFTAPQRTVLVKAQIPQAKWHKAFELIENKQFAQAVLYWQPLLKHPTTNQSHHNRQIKRLIKRLSAAQDWQGLRYLWQQGYSLPQDISQQMLMEFKLPASLLPTVKSSAFYTQLQQVNAPVNCLANVLLLSDHRLGMNKLQQFRQRFIGEGEPQQHALCFSPPVYVGDMLKCQPQRQQFARCNWSVLAAQPQLMPAGFHFIVMMSSQGKANVQSGIMQLSSDAPYHVFIHELMHFSGFYDEYRAANKVQQIQCQQNKRFGINLYIGEQPPQGWVKSPYCDNGRAYKPSPEVSIMQRSSVGLTAFYRALWQAQLAYMTTQQLVFADYFYHLSQQQKWQKYKQEALFSTNKKEQG